MSRTAMVEESQMTKTPKSASIGNASVLKGPVFLANQWRRQPRGSLPSRPADIQAKRRPSPFACLNLKVSSSCEAVEVYGSRAQMHMFFYGFLSAYAMSALVVALLLWKVSGRQLA